MEITLQNCYLSVDDHEKAVAFYRDAMGFEVRMDVGRDTMRWITVGPPSQPDVSIVLGPPAPGPGTSPSDRAAINDLLAKGLLGFLVFRTDDCDASFDRIQATGADVLQEPMDQAWGVRDCAFRDPAGNHIRIQQPRR